MDQSPRPKLRPKLKLSYNDLKKIERVVNAEAKGEGVEGRNAVRGVIFNRLMSDRFPDTVDEVLSPSQFEPVRKYGSIDKIPVDENTLNEQLTEMADYIQLGEDTSKGSTFFLNKELSKKRGTDFGGESPMVIGNHTFYKGYQGQEPVTDVNFSHNIEVEYQGYDEGGVVSKFMDMITSPVTGDYRKEKPLSVQSADAAVSLTTPIDSIVEIQEELKKENPDYLKIGMLGGVEAISLLAPGAGKTAQSMIRKGADMARQTDNAIDVASNVPKVAKSKFKNTVKAYKLFTKGEDGKLYPLFVDADTEVPVGQYMKAVFPEYRFKAANGNFYVPSRGTAGKKGTGDAIKIPDQETRDMLIEAGFLPKNSKAKTIKAVAARPGWHAGDTPMAKHIGPEVVIDGKTYKIRGEDQVWAEVEMPADTDWQAIADSRAVMKKDGTPNVKTAHITDELPFGGYYRYKTNPNMEGQWLISGDMKVNRVLDRDEVKRINAEAGFEDLPTEAELKEQLGKGFAAGGLAGEDMYQGVDDYQMAEMGAGMKEGGSVEKQTEAMFKSSRGYAEGGEVGAAPDTTIGVDPVSGNEVPMGATPEEVRDDIPAQLSEGEYVVPADVVRFYGVKFFEDLRTEAKQGYAEMDQNGRIGGEPVGPEGMEMIEPEDDLPFDISELQTIDDEEMPVGAAEGGYFERAINREKPYNRFESLLQFLFKDKDEYGETPIDRYKEQMGDDDMGFFESMMGNPIERGERKYGKKGYADGGEVTATPTPQNPFSITGSGSYEIKEYVNDAGEVMYIQFMNGQPMTFIPQGFKPKGTAAEQAAAPETSVEATAAPATTSDDNYYDTGTEMGKVDDAFTQGASAKDWTKASVDDFASATKNLGSAGIVGTLAGALLPGPLGLAAGIGSQSQARVKAYDMLDGISYQLESLNADPTANKDKIAALTAQKKELQKIVSTGDDGKSDDGFLGKSGIYGGASSMYERLNDTGGGGYDADGNPIGDGRVSFADTWLGDLLGADGKAGVQGPGLSESRAGARRTGAFGAYEGDRDRAAERMEAREATPYEKAMAEAAKAPAGSAEQKQAYGSAAQAATNSWIAAGNAVESARKSGDIRAEHEARMAQAEASRAATAAKQAETGWTGFFSPPKKPKN